jgi:hypothetical protein
MLYRTGRVQGLCEGEVGSEKFAKSPILGSRDTKQIRGRDQPEVDADSTVVTECLKIGNPAYRFPFPTRIRIHQKS